MLYITRDKGENGFIKLFEEKPQRNEWHWGDVIEHWDGVMSSGLILTKDLCNAILGFIPEWEDEPVEIEIKK